MVSGEESVNGESFGQFDVDNQLEKVKKKKKRNKEYNMVASEEFVSSEIFRKFDTDNQGNPDALNEKTVTEARESNKVVRNVEKKKKKKRKRTAEEENDNDEGQENLAGEKMLKIL
ncbi:hypothetical protein POM88_004501 [Heracleum sosnowskyi]|uniref:Uncharacterized protein n=1 Tax=Heracleum sosnowskyi TaxID=360622 RepID=A0AAD8NE38_9APIA|nr:hypothetical protein POM88_004501 [Heracleum sosnowskyi]